MSNGFSDLYKYFPAGSTDLTAIRQRIESLEEQGILTENIPVLTKKGFDNAMVKQKKDSDKKFNITSAIAILSIIATIVMGFIAIYKC